MNNEPKHPAVAGPLDGRVRSQPRLYVVRIVREAFVLASSESEALAASDDIERWEDFPTITAYKWVREDLEGWTGDCLVYCRERKDITLDEAKTIHAAA